MTDKTGSAIPGANVTVVEQGTNFTRTVQSGVDGHYTLLALPPGTYNVTIARTGFATQTEKNVVLRVNQDYIANATLQVGSTSQTVEVNGNPVQVQTTSTQNASTINSTEITNLPLNGRNWVQLQQTLPGVATSSDRFGSNFSTNGSRTQSNNYLINGTDWNDLPLNTPLAPPSPDAIQEVQVITSTLLPEYGKNSGAILVANVKNGTNSLAWRRVRFSARHFHERQLVFRQRGGPDARALPSEPVWRHAGRAHRPQQAFLFHLLSRHAQRHRVDAYDLDLHARRAQWRLGRGRSGRGCHVQECVSLPHVRRCRLTLSGRWPAMRGRHRLFHAVQHRRDSQCGFQSDCENAAEQIRARGAGKRHRSQLQISLQHLEPQFHQPDPLPPGLQPQLHRPPVLLPVLARTKLDFDAALHWREPARIRIGQFRAHARLHCRLDPQLHHQPAERLQAELRSLQLRRGRAANPGAAQLAWLHGHHSAEHQGRGRSLHRRHRLLPLGLLPGRTAAASR